MLRACLIVAAFGVPFASTSAQQTLLQFEGSAALDAYGWALAGGRDLNGDGVPDAAIGVPQDALTFDSATGRALVYSGATGTELFDLKDRFDKLATKRRLPKACFERNGQCRPASTTGASSRTRNGIFAAWRSTRRWSTTSPANRCSGNPLPFQIRLKSGCPGR